MASSPNTTAPTANGSPFGLTTNLTWGVGTGIGTASIKAVHTASTATQNLTILSSVADGSRTATTAPNFAVNPGPLGSFTWNSISSPQTAGTPFTVTATAYDTFGNIKTDYNGSGAVLSTNMASSPNTTAPTANGSPFGLTTNLTWGVGTGIGTASIKATRATISDTTPTGTTQNLTILSSVADGSRTATTAPNFAVTPNTVTTLTFFGPPIDTQVNTPIYSACAPPASGSTAPCADYLSGTGTLSTPVRVYAVDGWGNPVLQTNMIDVTAAPNALVGGTKTISTFAGYATFGNLLSESQTGTGIKLTATAQANPTVAKVTSNPFRVVTTLKGCSATSTTCVNKALGDTTSKFYVNSWSQITTNSCFYCGTTNVLQSTQLVVNSSASQCGITSFASDQVDQRVTGTNTQVASSGYELIVIPKATLKTSGFLNRSPGNFNICFGAIWIGPGSDTTPGAPGAGNGWWGKTSATNNHLVRATRVADPNVSPQGYRFYGILADCGTAGLAPDKSDPCILKRTKQKSDIQALLGTDAAAIMTDADLGIVIRIGDPTNPSNPASPWDGGSHPF
jgi:hypothetical protein